MSGINEKGRDKDGGGSKGKEKESPKTQSEKKKDEAAASNGKGGASSGWTTEQDAKIKSMKDVGNSWKMIAQTVGASKKDVQQRYKEITQGGSGSKGGETKDDKSNGEADDGLGEMLGLFDEGEEEAAKKETKRDGEKRGGKGKKGEKGRVQKLSGQVRLRPDDVWTKEDCDILDMLETRYTEHKWLHLQAGFYNWTGRMVVGEMIERKFVEDGAL